MSLPGCLSNLPAPESGVRHAQADTEAWIGGRNLGSGTLLICESRVAWTPADPSAAASAFSLHYPAICLHAVSKDPSAFHKPHLYLMIDADLLGDANGNGEAEADEDEEEEETSPTTEVRFCPADAGQLQDMFSAMADCQALHPDEEDADSDYGGEGEEEEEEEGEYGEEEREEEEEVGANGVTGGGDGEQPMDTDQFEDAP